MRGLDRLFWIPLLIIGWSCNNEPNLPNTPRIEFIKAEYWDMGLQNQDSFNITISFEDGDGDLGLFSDESFYPYHSTFFFTDNDTAQSLDGVIESLLKLSKRSIPGLDTLPQYVNPFACNSYIVNPIIQDNIILIQPGGGMKQFVPGLFDTVIQDTIYFQANPNHFNFLVDFMVKDDQGNFVRFPWESFLGIPDCGQAINVRFSPADVGTTSMRLEPIEGQLTYRFLSFVFPFEFRNKEIKLRLRIKDRALNTSNTVETSVFTLDDIQVN